MNEIVDFFELHSGGFLIFSDGSIKYITFDEIKEIQQNLLGKIQEAA